MSKTLSYILVSPYTISKSRTGGVISRILSRGNDLEFVGAAMIAPDESFVRDYASSLREQAKPNKSFLADYVERSLQPQNGKKQRVLLLAFEGEDTCRKLTEICGHLYPEHREVDSIVGQTIRDTYADLVVSPDDPQQFIFLEPAVLTPRGDAEARTNMALINRLIKNSGNIIDFIEYNDKTKVERTLVILKPDNWTFSSARPGTIIDMLSQTGLRIIGTKMHHFSQEAALEFYGPVEDVLKNKLSPIFGKKARELLEKAFGVPLNDKVEKALSDSFGVEYALDQFYQIVEFMSGHRPDRKETRAVKCMILVYEGENAVQKIRDVLGPTDPSKAPAGTIRKEFGSNVMVNAAHASDSTESFEREQKIVAIHENDISKIIDDYLK
ncbi:MAG: hypothetical protein Ta2B_11830 [Termitinemataceae bacterium]|nr:MAG: hypothetical protein Ta2B_11830 [Termitinemataceae bacterium]